MAISPFGVVTDIHVNCNGPVCYHFFTLRHVVSRTPLGWVVECSRCYTTRPARPEELGRAYDRLGALSAANEGRLITCPATR